MEVVGFFKKNVDVESPEVTSKSDVTPQIDDDATTKAEIIWTFIGFRGWFKKIHTTSVLNYGPMLVIMFNGCDFYRQWYIELEKSMFALTEAGKWYENLDFKAGKCIL